MRPHVPFRDLGPRHEGIAMTDIIHLRARRFHALHALLTGVTRALRPTRNAERHGPQTSHAHLQTKLAGTPSSSVHHFSIERKKL